MATEAPKSGGAKRYKLAKGQSLVIAGVSTPITNANVNDESVLTIIRNAERSGRKYFGTSIVEA